MKMNIKVATFFLLISKSICSQISCGEENSVDISKGTHLSNGDIYFGGVKFKKSDYYFNNETKTERGCLCNVHVCVRKCCHIGFGYDTSKKRCVNVRDVFDPLVGNEYEITNKNASEKFHFLYGKQNCSKRDHESRIRITSVPAWKDYRLRIMEDGQLFVDLPTAIPPWQKRSPDKYCIDTFVYPDGSTKLDALLCFSEEQEEKHYLLSSTCMLISCVFFLATVGVYAWLPELRNLHGKVLMAYLLCLFVGFAFLAAMQILLMMDNIIQSSCTILTIIIYYSLLAAFFWLNVMCFDIWWTFSGKRGLSLEKLTTRARFYAYCLYAFAIPTLLTVLLASLEYSGLPASPWMPNLRQGGCFIHGISKLIYLYGPIVILCVANMVFFILTALKIAKINRQTSVLKSKESATHDQHGNDKQRLLLYVKLFAVMGVSWLLEVASAVFPDAAMLWRITDAYNVLIGLIVFVIFVCKRKIFRLMKKRYKQLRGEPMSRTQTTSSRTMSSNDMRMSSVKTAH